MTKALLLVLALASGAPAELYASTAPAAAEAATAVYTLPDSLAQALAAAPDTTKRTRRRAQAAAAATAVMVTSLPAPAVVADTVKKRPTPLTGLAEVLQPVLAPEVIPNMPDEVIIDRLSCLETTIPLTFNPNVRQFIDYFTIRNRKYTRTMLERQNVYFPLFEKYLAKHNMPDELKYLAVVESGLNPKACSRTKAMGLWQFMAPTANDYRLVQNQYIDERLDPEKATEAACRFLKALYGMFGDWHVALAAYNCGPGNVRKAVNKAGGKVDFWAIYPYLPQETRGYVPSFIAIAYAMTHAEEHNIRPDTIRYAHATDTLLVSRYLDLQRLSEQLCIAPEYLMNLNPALKVQYIPEHFTNYPLRVPSHATPFIAQNRWWLLDSCRKGAATPPAIAGMLPQSLKPQASVRAATVARTQEKKVVYTVKKGDVLGRIADKHDVTVADLKKWNKLKGTNINAGQTLIVMKTVPAAAPASPAKPAIKPTEERSNLAAAQTAAAKAKPTLNPTPAPVAEARPAAKPAPKEYQVQPGDTLYSISRRFEGLTVEQLKKLNNLKSNDIKVGQTLILG